MAFVVLIFGEDATDTSAIALLVEAINDKRPSPLSDLKIKMLREPAILRRDTSSLKLKTQAEKIASFVRGHRLGNRAVVAVAHRDCDDIEPHHERCADELLKDLSNAGVDRAVVAAPAWEIEAWWMLFPEAVSAVRPCWRRLDYGNSDVGLIRHAKDRLRRDLRPIGSVQARCPDFTERDGVKIAKIIKVRGLKNFSVTARSQSFARFSQDLEKAMD